jgi:hypothetical protein
VSGIAKQADLEVVAPPAERRLPQEAAERKSAPAECHNAIISNES